MRRAKLTDYIHYFVAHVFSVLGSRLQELSCKKGPRIGVYVRTIVVVQINLMSD